MDAAPPPTPATLARQLAPSAVSRAAVHAKYRPMQALVRELIGVVPNSDTLLEIWPTGLRSYNLLVPNALNLPFALWGMGAPKAHIGLAMLAASRAAACAYCTAHSCTFALRRGAQAGSLVGDGQPREAAVVAVSEAMARIPSEMTALRARELRRHFSEADTEWLVLAVAMMGFLNKFMDATGVELEARAVADVAALLTPTGWTPGKHEGASGTPAAAFDDPPVDTLRTYARVIRHAPSAIRLERRWTRGVPAGWPEAGAFLETHTGHRFPLLGRLRHARAIRALATILRDNLDPLASGIGLGAKALAGLVYAAVVGNETLAHEARLLAARFAPDLDAHALDRVRQIAGETAVDNAASIREAREALTSLDGLAPQDANLLLLARAASTSPSEIGPAILAEITPRIEAAHIVELLVWLSVQQLLHRLSSFYDVSTPA